MVIQRDRRTSSDLVNIMRRINALEEATGGCNLNMQVTLRPFSIREYNVQTGELVNIFHPNRILSGINFTKDNHIIFGNFIRITKTLPDYTENFWRYDRIGIDTDGITSNATIVFVCGLENLLLLDLNTGIRIAEWEVLDFWMRDVAIAPDGKIWVCGHGNGFDDSGHRIIVFSNSGVILNSFPFPSSTAFTGIDISQDGKIFIVDSPAHRILRLNQQGEIEFSWGEFGVAPGQFDNPIGVTISSNNTIFITDFFNKRIQVFNENGVFQRQWSTEFKPFYTTIIPTQTTFYKYPTTRLDDIISLGTPDGGIEIPDLTSFERLIPRGNEIVDIKNAIELLVCGFINVDTGVIFDWEVNSINNLYSVAVTAGSYTWILDIDAIDYYRQQIVTDLINEFDLCLTVLESSSFS